MARKKLSFNQAFDRAMRTANTVGKRWDDEERKDRERDVRLAKAVRARREPMYSWESVKAELGL